MRPTIETREETLRTAMMGSTNAFVTLSDIREFIAATTHFDGEATAVGVADVSLGEIAPGFTTFGAMVAIQRT